MKTALLVFLACGTCVPAQWLRQPTAGIPRDANGRPNLSAPAPRTADGHPDISGLWRRNPKYILDITVDLKPDDVAPSAQAVVKQRSEDLLKDHPGVLCLPSGPAYAVFDLAKIVQTPALLVVLHQDLTYRQIFMDGRALEKDPNPNWMGYSVAHWDGDTLVVETNGYNERTWLDGTGHPHTEALRTTERYRRLDFGRMELQYTLEDPKVYAKPITLKIDMFLMPDTEMLEYVCNENEKDRSHMIGKASDEKRRAVVLAPEALAKYAGNYQAGPQVIPIALERGELTVNVGGLVVPLIPISETRFSSPLLGQVDFTKDAEGNVTQLLLQTVGAETLAVRRK
jgi:hypothetical protein